MTKVRVNKQVEQIERKVRETCCTQYFFLCVLTLENIFPLSRPFMTKMVKNKRKIGFVNDSIKEIMLKGKWKIQIEN